MDYFLKIFSTKILRDILYYHAKFQSISTIRTEVVVTFLFFELRQSRTLIIAVWHFCSSLAIPVDVLQALYIYIYFSKKNKNPYWKAPKEDEFLWHRFLSLVINGEFLSKRYVTVIIWNYKSYSHVKSSSNFLSFLLSLFYFKFFTVIMHFGKFCEKLICVLYFPIKGNFIPPQPTYIKYPPPKIGLTSWFEIHI